MDELKNKMYNYETQPPAGVWESISSQLENNEAKVIPLHKKSNRFYYLAAASIVVILLCLVFFTNRSSNSEKGEVASSDKVNGLQNNDTITNTKNDKVIITVPEDDKNSIVRKSNKESLPKNTTAQNTPNEKIKKENTKKTISDNNLIADNTASSYITVEGPQGQPVKVSSKMASLIDSSETKISSKPIWNKKITEWREIMKGNTLAPTPGNFLDIVELTKSLKDHK